MSTLGPQADESEAPIQPELDWEAYFEDFRSKHGWPVPYDTRWLFPDGWSYAMNSMEGPEWPPPEDPQERKRLIGIWKTTRKRIVKEQFHDIRLMISNLRERMEERSATLQQKVILEEEDDLGNTYKVYSGEVKPINIAPYEERLECLREELRQLNEESVDERPSNHDAP